MGNGQQKEVDVLEAIINMQDEASYNFSACEERWLEILNKNSSLTRNTDIDYESDYSDFVDKCLNKTLPSELLNQPYILPWYQQLAWTLVYAIMILVAIVGNLIVIWIIVAHKRMRTVTNLFLLNLAITDFLLASGNAAFNFVFMLNSHWPFGNTFCVISNFVANLTVSTSVFMMLALSLDRFVAVTRPLRPRMSRSLACSIILIVWTVSSLLSFPTLLYATTITFKYSDDQQRTLCFLLWPDEHRGNSFFEHLYNIVFFVVTYVVPMGCMSITYTWIGCILWGSKVIGESTDLQSQAIKSKQKVVHMLIAVMLLFAICWLPYHIYFLYTFYNKEILQTGFIQHVYLTIYWFAMSNSCYNPIVYYNMNARFRGYFQDVLCIGHSKNSSEVIAMKDGQKSLPVTARNSVFSNRTRSTRLSFPRRKKENPESNANL